MATNGERKQARRVGAHGARRAIAAGIALGLVCTGTPARAGDDDDDDREDGKYCSATARALLDACRHEGSDDYARARALCINRSHPGDRKACFAEARLALREGRDQCAAQNGARRQLCGMLGEGRYDPDFDPAKFQTDFRNPAHPNRYFPLRVGNRWRLEGDGEVVSIEVLDQTKLIEGVTCVVVRDRVEQDGVVVEDTDDWFALRLDRTVDYCGESARNFELFPGDNPPAPELVDVDGSWKAGRDGDLPGTQFPGSPGTGMVYRQEFSPGNAEDAAEVVSTTYGLNSDPELDRFVPSDLVRLLCGAYNCVVTREFTPIEPGVFQYKYYARDIGLFLEVNPRSGAVVRLTDCNLDVQCAAVRALPK